MSRSALRAQGAREYNLKDVSVEIPKRRLTVFTGVSGSDKSYVAWRNRHAQDRMLREVVKRANLA